MQGPQWLTQHSFMRLRPEVQPLTLSSTIFGRIKGSPNFHIRYLSLKTVPLLVNL